MTRSTHKRTYKKRSTGGASASQFAEYAFGGPDAQRAAAGGNTIAPAHDVTKYSPLVKGGSAASPLLPLVKGGKKNNKSKKGGKGMLTELAVPALLVYANTVIKPSNIPKKVFGNKSKRNNRK
jgi:hypothetical protein